jgi:hypothetical protein
VHVFAAMPAITSKPAPSSIQAPVSAHHVGTMAWLLPVLLGLMLTAVACYKHRGLPGGH